MWEATKCNSSPSKRNTLAYRLPQRETAFRTIVSNTGCTSAGEVRITRRISAVAFCCSSASLSSCVRRSSCSWKTATEELRPCTDFVALRRFSVTVLRRRVLTGSPPALERRLIAFPKAQDKASCRLKIAHWKVDGCEFRHRALSVRPMSALGQKRTWRDQIAMSALPPKADIG